LILSPDVYPVLQGLQHWQVTRRRQSRPRTISELKELEEIGHEKDIKSLSARAWRRYVNAMRTLSVVRLLRVKRGG
jgi:hypothetical protein